MAKMRVRVDSPRWNGTAWNMPGDILQIDDIDYAFNYSAHCSILTDDKVPPGAAEPEAPGESITEKPVSAAPFPKAKPKAKSKTAKRKK